MVSIVGKRIQAGMSFNSSHDSDDADSEHGNGSESGTHDDGSSDNFFIQNQNTRWETKKINTVWVGGMLIFITVCLLYILAIIVTVECGTDPNPTNGTSSAVKHGILCDVPAVSLIMYLQSLLWCLFLICDQYIQYEHVKARRRGYLEFYNQTRTLSQIPFCIVSAWCALLLAIAMVLHDNCISENQCGHKVHLSKSEYALFVVVLEGLLIIICSSIYIYKVHKFNVVGAPPDVMKDEFMSVATDYNPNSVGIVDEEIFQRQADVIRYLSEHNEILRRKVMELNRQIMEHSHSV